MSPVLCPKQFTFVIVELTTRAFGPDEMTIPFKFFAQPLKSVTKTEYEPATKFPIS